MRAQPVHGGEIGSRLPFLLRDAGRDGGFDFRVLVHGAGLPMMRWDAILARAKLKRRVQSASFGMPRRNSANAAASRHPATMPNVRSLTIVSPNVAIRTSAVRQSRSSTANSRFSAIFQDTTTSTPASADSGMNEASGAAVSMNSSRKTACSMPDTGLRAPARMFVAVRAIVPVTLMPPNSADTI